MPVALVYGVAITGTAVISALIERGYTVIAADDNVTDEKRMVATEHGITLVEAPSAAQIHDLVINCDFVAPAPAIAEHHPVVAAALSVGRPLRTELDLAYEWEQQRVGGPRPMLGVTGTDGKTTTTCMATAMLQSAGLRAAAVGNTEIPLVAMLHSDADVFVVECSSFRLHWTELFRPQAAVWLNLAPDHLNWHRNLDSYISAKARMWRFQRPDDIAIGFADDPTVMRFLSAAPGRKVTFGQTNADYCTQRGYLVSPLGKLCAISSMRRSLPHDITNALAAAALVETAGLADAAAIGHALEHFEGPPHRIEPVGQARGISWYNDSKATSPHAALTAIRAFDRLVLIAGGRNKGLDLSSLASEPQRMQGVVAIGESGPEVAEIFAGICEVRTAATMEQAVQQAAAMAVSGDAVVLSPGCTSFDWYAAGGYPARGDDFRRSVLRLLRTQGNQEGQQ